MRKTISLALLLLLTWASGAVAAEERPAFPEIQLSDLNGKVYQLHDYLGAVTLLNFWAVWCGPCRMELPELQKIYNELGRKGFVVLAIAVDTPKEQVKPFMERLGITLPAMLIDQETQASLGVSRIPFTVLLDRDGKVVQVYPGYSREVVEDIHQRAEALLAGPHTQGQGGK
jgi:thiol-disulfide isomerase/thioredoxin